MRLKNSTDIPDDWIRACVAAVRPPGISNFQVTVTNTTAGASRGRMTFDGGVLVRVPRTEKGARFVHNVGGAYLPIAYGSRRETLLVVLAHELRHLWQQRIPRGRRVWGSRGQYSERDADAYALQMLRRYRRGELDLS